MLACGRDPFEAWLSAQACFSTMAGVLISLHDGLGLWCPTRQHTCGAVAAARIFRKPDAVERTFALEPVEGLPKALGAALLDLSKLAASMHPDDISLSLDLPAGI